MKNLKKLISKISFALITLVTSFAALITINQQLIKKGISTFKISEPFIWEVKIIYLSIFLVAIVLYLGVILLYSIIYRKNIHVRFFKISYFKLRGKYLLYEHFEEIIRQIKSSIVDEILIKQDLQKNVSIYQFGSSSPKRSEFHTTTSNINLLITANNDTVNKLLQDLNEIKSQLNKVVKFSFLNIHFYTSYQEDMHSIYSSNDLNIYLLIRPREYLIEKSISQPLFILNIINDAECLYGDNQLLNLNHEKIKLSISYTNLLRGAGGIIELKTFLADSAFHIGYNNIAFLRSLRYVIFRSLQIFILFKDNKLISKNSELLKSFENALFENVLFENVVGKEKLLKYFDDNKLKTKMDFVWGGSFKLKKHKIDEIRHIHSIAYSFIVNIESQMEKINNDRKNIYIGFSSRSMLENTVDLIKQELLNVIKNFRIQLITHALDDTILAEYVNRLLLQHKMKSSLFIYESPELLGRFNVSDCENQFRFYDDFENTDDNTLILYVGNGTVIGKLLEVTLRAFYSKFYLEKTEAGIDWGCLLINVNPNGDDKDVWKEYFTNLKKSRTFLNYPKIELLISKDGTRL